MAVFDRMPDGQVANRRKVFAVLRRLFRSAVSRGEIDRSPMEGMDGLVTVWFRSLEII